MPRPGVLFASAPPAGEGLSARADVALFVGLVARREGDVPAPLLAALEEAGWAGDGPFARSDADAAALLDMPVPVESWDDFDKLFDWQARSPAPGDPRRVPCAMGMAVRTFFAQGGAKAWVVRIGDPLPVNEPEATTEDFRAARRAILSVAPAVEATLVDRVPLLAGLGAIGTAPSPRDPATWRGAAHVWGVDEAAMLLMPDLPDLCAPPPEPVPVVASPEPPEEIFRPCGPLVSEAAALPAPLPLSAPRLDGEGWDLWIGALGHALGMLEAPGGAHHRRDVMLLASLPRPARGAGDPLSPLETLAGLITAGGAPALSAQALGTRRLQLGYPWLGTPGSAGAAEGLEGAEGALAGMVAANAMFRGAHRAAAGTPLRGVARLAPELGSGDLARGLAPGPEGGADWAGDRLSLVARGPEGFRLVSDATCAVSLAERSGGVARLIGVILRAARQLGQEVIFDPSGETLWAEIRGEIEGLMQRLDEAGAFADGGRDPAWDVRCGRDTMTQSDIDDGRVIAEVSFRAAQPVQQVRVTLALGRAREGAF